MMAERDSSVFSDDAFRALLDAACCDVIDGEQFDRLEDAMLDSEEARRLYLRYLSLESELHYLVREMQAGSGKVERGEWRGAREEKVEEPRTTSHWSQATSSSPQPLAPSPSFIPPAALPHPPSSSFLSLDTPLGGFLFSYGASGVLVGILLLIFSMMNSPSQRGKWIAGNSPVGPHRVVAPLEPTPEPEVVSVGLITSMVDCKWVDARQAPAYYKIKLNDKFALTSGMMEITYHTGAKVILQGPCAYEVESAGGGFLSLGKLTARVEKKVASGKEERGEGRGESESTGKASGTLAPSPQPLAPSPSSLRSPLSPLPSPLFSVRTPTVIVTDLGTEFGVKVENSGASRVETIVGLVAVQPLRDGKPTGSEQRLAAGKAFQIDSAGAVVSVPTNTKSFVRRIRRHEPSPYSRAVLADKPLAYWPLSELKGSKVVGDISGNGMHGIPKGDLELGVSGPPVGPRSTALRTFGGYVDCGVSWRWNLGGPISVEAWVCPDHEARGSHFIVARRPSGGWGLGEYLKMDEPLGLQHRYLFTYFAVKDYRFDDAPLPLREQWSHVVATCDAEYVARLYVNGCLQAAVPGTSGGDLSDNPHLMIGRSQLEPADYFWMGSIAHVAVYDQALSERQIQTHYQTILKTPLDEKGAVDEGRESSREGANAAEERK